MNIPRIKCFFISALVLILLYSCQNSRSIKLKQYQAAGRALYLKHCSSCHQTDGKGLAALYPPVAFADYLMDDISRSICITRNGLSGEIVVNGKSYNLPMPANQQLSNLEIAEIMTYLTTVWGREKKLITPTQVENTLGDCDPSLSGPLGQTE